MLGLLSIVCGCGELTFSGPRLPIETLQISLFCWEDNLPTGERRRLEIQIRNQDGKDVSDFPQAIIWSISPPSVASLGPSNGADSRILTTLALGDAMLRITATYVPDSRPDHAVVGALEKSLGVLSASELPAYSPTCFRV